MTARQTHRRCHPGLAGWLLLVVLPVLPGCTSTNHPRASIGAGIARSESLSVQAAIEMPRGTDFLFALRDGSEIRGDYRGKDAGRDGEMTIVDRDGVVRHVAVEKIESVQIVRAMASSTEFWTVLGGLAFLATVSVIYFLGSMSRWSG